MNVIKLKDIIMPGDTEEALYFNKHLKGKYAYWVQMRYIVSFDHMRHEGYVACEEDISKLLPDEVHGVFPMPYGAPSFDVYDEKIIPYIDTVETDKINSVIPYRIKNKFTADSDITIDELKKFRTWLATELLKMDQNHIGLQRKLILTEKETLILNYYASGMHDEIVKILNTVGGKSINLTQTSSTCGCHYGTDISSLYNSSIEVCDPIKVYRENIYNGMVELFSNTNFWTQWAKEFIIEFKKYIDNIIKCNFTLSRAEWYQIFADCGCKDSDDQAEMLGILKRLSLSLEYISTGNIAGNKNYITDALTDWSSILYEKMEW